jgi:hypothetical protein
MRATELMELIARDRERDRQVVVAVEKAIREDDPPAFGECLDAIEDRCLWPKVMRRIAKLPPAGPRMREGFARVFVSSGDHFRQEAGSDRVLVDALRVLMPPLRGTIRNFVRGGAVEPIRSWPV